MWIRFYGQGFRLSLCGPGARVFTGRRWFADAAHGHGFACLSVVLVLVCSLPDVGLRMRLMGMDCFVSPWSWCSCVHSRRWYADTALWAWIALSLRGPGARVFSAMEIPLLQYFPGGRCPCSVLSCSDRGDSTGTVLGSVDDVAYRCATTGAGSDSAESVLVPQLRSRSLPVVAQRQVPWSKLLFDHGHSQLQYTMADVPVMQTA